MLMFRKNKNSEKIGARARNTPLCSSSFQQSLLKTPTGTPRIGGGFSIMGHAPSGSRAEINGAASAMAKKWERWKT
uniref:Uncharacterized protein n=1 Tax=Candidatus Kentrum sp. UNK TaxID=2126344 RepID=A0A451AYJ5_9GAMM|nr:MAG: hypothetical protein BECKUNK1418G_GA0071005_11178 [Candidatus Kentron sp. UNK]VFK71100.1 MAG: hypothetical protein BECKUNK1418H_GA0071006_105020 [Candidatus Kentron sp. UNK]